MLRIRSDSRKEAEEAKDRQDNTVKMGFIMKNLCLSCTSVVQKTSVIFALVLSPICKSFDVYPRLST